MRTISQNAAFNQFHNIAVNESNVVSLRPAAEGGSIAVLNPFGRPLVCVTCIRLVQNILLLEETCSLYTETVNEL